MALDYLDIDENRKNEIRKDIQEKLDKHNAYIREYGVDLPEIENWNFND